MAYKQKIRIGFGYDVHPFAKGRKLVLGGVEIPFSYGLSGHSDADVLIHAICDAVLGAAALGDIGKHFPDSDKKYKDISSLILLKEVVKLVKNSGYVVGNIDITVVAQKPKLAPYVDAMVNQISKTMDLDKNSINIKATTTEGLGFAGRLEGIASYAVALLVKENE